MDYEIGLSEQRALSRNVKTETTKTKKEQVALDINVLAWKGKAFLKRILKCWFD